MSIHHWKAAVCLLILSWGSSTTAKVHAQGREAPRPEVRGLVKSVGEGTITILTGEGRDAAAAEKTFALAKNLEVAISMGLGGRGGFFKEGKLADLSEGVRVALSLTADQKTVDSILTEGPMVRGLLKSVDMKKNTITLAQQAQREQAAVETTYSLAPNAEIAVDDGRGRRFSIKEAKITDVADGALVTAWLSLDKKKVESLLAEGPNYFGVIKAIDLAKKTVTMVVRPARGEEATEEKTLALAAEAAVLVDDGKGRRLSLKEAKLADVPVGASAAVKMSTDQYFVMQLRVEGPVLTGRLKAVDADKGIVVLTIPKGRGEDPDEKSLPVIKGARITIDGAAGQLAGLKVGEEGHMVMLRLSLDQRTVMSITALQPRPRE